MRILAIDDESLVREVWELELGNEHTFVGVATAAEARQVWTNQAFDVVFLDQNLEGEYGGPAGLDLIDEARLAQPAAEIYVVSGYPESPGAVATALNRGVQDYLVKGRGLSELLAAKLAQTEARIELRRKAAMTDADRQAELEGLWQRLQTETDAQVKGSLLEQFVEGMLRVVGGFQHIERNARRRVEELDVIATAADGGTRLSWSRVWLFECKHWAAKVGRDQVDVLFRKMERRHGLCRVGVLIAWSGLSAPGHEVVAHEKDAMILVLTQDDLAAFVRSKDKPKLFLDWVHRAAAQ